MATLYGPPQREPPALLPVPDLAETPVHDVVGQPLGATFGSLAEAESGLIRYVDVAVAGTDRHVLVPIGHVRLEERDGRMRLRLRAASREDLDEIPSYEAGKDEVDGVYQQALLAAHGRLFYGERYYAHPAYDHSGLYAGNHPVVRDGEESPLRGRAEAPRLGRLRELPGFRVAPGEPDIRGWSLVAGDGGRAGTVRELVIDLEERKVRYAVIARPAGGDTLLPVGFLEIDAERRAVRAPALGAEDIAGLPEHAGFAIRREEEERLREALARRIAGERRFLGPDFRGAGTSGAGRV
jgi:photosynthetic reaction center H subunit